MQVEKSECCNAEITTKTKRDYPMSSNPFSQDYVVQDIDKQYCSECGEEL